MTGMKKRSHTQTLLIVMVIFPIAAGLAAFIFLDVGTAKKMLRCADQEWGVNESSLKPEQAEYAWMKRKKLR